MSNSSWPHGAQHTRPPCPSPIPRVYSNLCQLGRWCHPTISSSVVPLLLPSIFPSIRVFSNESALHIRRPKYWSFSLSISPSMNIQDWFPLGWTGWISFKSKRLSRVFSNTTVQKHQFFSTQISLYGPFMNHSDRSQDLKGLWAFFPNQISPLLNYHWYKVWWLSGINSYKLKAGKVLIKLDTQII